MGNLSNLYISKSYQSLIHLETDNTASSTLVGLQDGLGNSIGISVNTSGSLSISGSFTASLANGYAWVGDGNNRTSLVPTSSFGSVTSAITGSSLITASFSGNTLTFTKGNNTTFGVVIPDVSGSGPTDISALNAFTASQYTINSAIGASTSSLNTFTSSQDTKNSTLATYTGSVDTKFSTIGTQSGSWDNTALNSFTQSQDTKNTTLSGVTASLNTSASLAIYTASFSGNTLTFTKGNSSTFSVVLPDVSGSDISSLNAFTQSQDTKNSTLATYTASIDTKFATIGSQSGSFATTGSNRFIGNQSITGSLQITGSNSNTIKGDLNVYNDARFRNPIYVGFGFTNYISGDPTGYALPFTISGRQGINFDNTGPGGDGLGPIVFTLGGGYPLQVYGTITASLFSGDGSALTNLPIQSLNAFTASVDTKFVAVGSSTSSLNAFTSSQNTKNSTLATYTGSNDTKWSNLGSQSGSWVTSAITASSLITASFSGNTLTFTKGNNTTFSVVIPDVSGSDLSSLNAFTASQEILNTTFATTGSNTFTGTNVFNQQVDFPADSALVFRGNGAPSTLVGLRNPSGSLEIVSLGTDKKVDLQNLSLLVSGTFTSSLANGFTFVGNGNGITTAVPTSSFVTTPTDISALNAFTQSQDTKNSTLATYTASVDTKFSTIGTQSGSWDNASLNAFTQSQDTKNSTLSTYTASVDQKFSNIGSQSGSWDNTNLNSFTQSVDTKFTAVGSSTASLNSFTSSQDTKNSTLATYTGSNDTKWSNLGSQSGSFVTESETGSFARTNVDNNFSVNQTFTTITALSASFTYLQTTFETSSVIYSSGSNQFGDELTDIQTLSGSVKIQGNLTINGTPVQTSSVDISSLNAFTQSQETKNNTLGSYTASVDTKFVAVGSSTASLNSYTQSQDTKNSTLGTYTASVDTKFSTIGTQSGSWDNTALNSFTQSQETKNSTLATYTGSNDTKWNTLGGQTGSYVTSGITGSSLVTASVSLNTITFTKGDASTFNITVNTGSAVTTDISSLNSFTQSQDTKNSTLATYTGSVDTKFSTIGTQSGSWDNTALNSFTQSVDTKFIAVGESTASLNAYTQSNDTKWSTLGGLTGSYVTSAITGSSLVTASFSGNTLTFTKGDSSTFGVIIPDVSGSDISALNAFTQSQDTKNSTLATYTGSVDTKFVAVGESTSSLNAFTSSQLSINTGYNTFTSSQETKNSTLATYTGSVDTKFATIGSQSGSWGGGGTDTGSLMVTGSVAGNVLTFTKGDSTQFSLTVATGSGGGGSTDTGSLLVTASFNTSTRNITFTKGDASQFNISGFATTGSNDFIGKQNFSASPADNVINILGTSKMTLGGNTTARGENAFFSIIEGDGVNQGGSLQFQIANAGSTFLCNDAATPNTGSTPITFENNTRSGSITFVNSGNTGQIRLKNYTGSIELQAGSSISISGSSTTIQDVNFIPFSASLDSRILAITGSGGGGGGATLGANTFTGSQIILTGSSGPNNTFQLGTDDRNFKAEFNAFSITNPTQANVTFNAPDTYWLNAGSLYFQNFNNFDVGSGSVNFSLKNGGSYLTQVQGGGTIVFSNNTGSISLTTPSELNLQSSVLKLKSADASFATQIVNVSGSLMLIAQSQSTASAHIAQASPVNSVNLIFKPNNNTGATVISGSSNIYTNPNTPTTGYTRYIGGSNNLYLNSSNGINSQITQSAASVSGNRPTMNNNIFNGDTNFLINQAVNTGTHTYSHNKIGGTNATVTINALSHTGSVNIQANTVNNAAITINASSASLAEIATGISGSGTVSVNSNFIQGAGITSTSPRTLLTTNTQNVINNVVSAGGITVTNISSSAVVNAIGNIANSAISYTNAGAAGLGLHTTAGAINGNYGGATIIASGSAVNFTNNIASANNLTVTNQAWSGSLGVGVFNILRNIFSGQVMTLLITGSVDGTGNTTGAFTDNAVIGKNNTIFSNQSGAGVHNSFISNVIGGERLIISASNSFNSTIGGGAYFGRWNADDGVRNKSGQTVFSVGTGISGSRKTGFLIDSGSNTFVEGSLNVSGSTTLSGSLYIQSGSTLPAATGSSVLTWNSATGQVSQSPIATLISSSFSVGAFNSTITQSGSAAVSQSMTFNNTDISNGITLNGGGTQLTIANTGTYNIQFSAQLLAGTGADTIWIWLKKNGTNVSNTGTKLVLANNEASVAAWNFVVTATATDYFELAWQSLDGHATLLTEVASGNYPAIPSVIVTVTQVE